MNREKRQERLAQALGRMLHIAEEALELAARHRRMHPTDLRCISLLSSSPTPMSPKEIIAKLGLTSGSGTALFDRLERLGYVSRIPNQEDRRSVLIKFDREAASEPLALLAELRGRYNQVTEKFTDAELDVISEYLEAVSKLTSENESS
jgi:DNA-binding MarR family transcriptional regulator